MKNNGGGICFYADPPTLVKLVPALFCEDKHHYNLS